MPDALMLIRDEIDRREEERRQADREVQDALALIAKQRHRIAECDAALESLNRVLDQLGASSELPVKAERITANGKKPSLSPTVRGLSTTLFAAMPAFTDKELFAKIREVIPHAKAGTIRGELSRAKGRGHIERMEDGSWISTIAAGSGNGDQPQIDLREPVEPVSG